MNTIDRRSWATHTEIETVVVSVAGEMEPRPGVCECATAELALQIVLEHNAHASLLAACEAVATFASCEDAADWKDASGRLIRLCAEAARKARRP